MPYGAFRALVDEIGPAQAEEDLRRLNVACSAAAGGEHAKALSESLREQAYPESAWWNQKPRLDQWDAFKAWAEGVQRRASRGSGRRP